MEWYIDMGDHITTYFFRITWCSAKIYPAAKKYPPPVTLPSVLSAVCIAQN